MTKQINLELSIDEAIEINVKFVFFYSGMTLGNYIPVYTSHNM